MSSFKQLADFFWSIADEILRPKIVRGKYKDVILPFTLLRRLDCVLAETKAAVLARDAELAAKGIPNKDGALRRTAGHAFYNTSPYDFEKLLADPKSIGKNLTNYLNGFSENMREVLEKFGLRETIAKLEEKGLLFAVVQKFAEEDLSPRMVDNHTIGTAFEELIRKYNEAMNENPGEHFTPREVIELMVRLLFHGRETDLSTPGAERHVYDPACGTGGMLSIAKEYVETHIKPTPRLRLYGQEANDETFAVCKADLFMKGDEADAGNIKPGSTLSEDGHEGQTFEFQLSNPPYGLDWKGDREAVEAERAREGGGRFNPGLPTIRDGQMLFLLNMIAKMSPIEHGGGRIAVIMNGSPLFNGDAGGGESQIRRYVMENDLLDAIIALPEQLFYNTGIATYVWVLTNDKPASRRDKVRLVNAAALWTPMRKSLGDKRRLLSPSQIEAIAGLYESDEPNDRVKVFDTTDFGYRKITVERPKRRAYEVTEAKIHEAVPLADDAGKPLADALRTLIPNGRYQDHALFLRELDATLKTAGVKLPAPAKKALLNDLGERDEAAEIVRDAKGNPEPESDLRDFENVPLKEDVGAYFDREVKLHVPDAWVNEDVQDEADGKVGKVGYEVNFNRVFYRYVPLRPLAEIERDIAELEHEIATMLAIPVN